MKISHESKTVAELLKMREQIHLNPAWQRGPVWTEPKKALLIDSILRGYDIPMIYLRDCPPSGTYKFEVVDGQQRFRSLWEFLDGEYRLSQHLEDIGSLTIASKYFQQLPKSLRDRLMNFRVVVAFVKQAREPEISRLFSRMQMGVRLNPAELRNAVQSGLRHAIDGVARLHAFFNHSRISATRFKHQDYLAHAISICQHSANQDLKAQQLMDDYIEISDAKVYGPLLAAADEILGFLYKINARTSRRLTQKWMFVDLFYLLYQHREALPKIDFKAFATTYLKFDQIRLQHNAVPLVLLGDSPTKEKQDVYDYIQAFKISGGEHKHLRDRNQILTRRFKSVVEV